MGFHVRDGNEQDVEDEVDIDGNDEDVFGSAQFTENDILCPGSDPHDAEAEIQSGGAGDGELQSDARSLRALVAEGKVAREANTGWAVQ